MSGAEDPLQRWNTRYAGDDFLFGEEPNAFLRAHVDLLQSGWSALCVADGEGRNSVFLAAHGLTVTAFDFAPNAVAKAKAMAARKGVRAEHRLADILTWDWGERAYDVVLAIFIQFLAPAQRGRVFAGMKRALRPGGLMMLQGYRPEQVDYGTGGPPLRENMYTREWLEAEFSGWEILQLRSYDAVIREGRGHSGMSALIDLVARKPGAEATS